MKLRHEFVDLIPDSLEERVVYVSVKYATVVHKCFCGCGNEVVTPLSRTDWKLTFDGESISLNPSIGSWNLRCQSHYWIEQDSVKWAPQWSESDLPYERKINRIVNGVVPCQEKESSSPKAIEKPGLWSRILGIFGIKDK
jgi:hypothetical protein